MKQWFIAYKKHDELFNTEDFKEVEAPAGYYYADPFIAGDYLFFEEFDHKKGVISVADISNGFTYLGKVLEENYHLSFPAVYELDDEYYMIPESGINSTVDLYKAVTFPLKWKKITTLLEPCIAGDPILYKQDDKYYLFVTVHGDNNLEVWSASELTGPWGLHHRGQYLHSRSAGHLFEHDGRLIRPCQDSTDLYGQSIVFKEITITPYTEKVYTRIDPDWDERLIGTHTYNFNDRYVVIDGKYEKKVDTA